MTNITESFLRGKIAESITSAETVPFTKQISKVPEVSVGYITISPETADEEILHYTSTSGPVGQSGTITISTRGYNKSGITTNVLNQKSHAINSLFKGTLNHLIINEKPDKTDLASSLNGKGASTIGIEDNAGQFVGTDVETALVELANGAPGVANGSETIAGKFEEATQVETNIGTITGGSGAKLVITPDKLKLIPGIFGFTGQITMWALPGSPSGWLELKGQAISRITYTSLFTLLGTTYGAGDGATTFNVPDFQGRTAIGVGAPPFSGYGLTGGSISHTLTVNEMPSHSHGVVVYTGVNASAIVGQGGSGNSSATTTTNSTGLSQPHNILSPYITINYIIKT